MKQTYIIPQSRIVVFNHCQPLLNASPATQGLSGFGGFGGSKSEGSADARSFDFDDDYAE